MYRRANCGILCLFLILMVYLMFRLRKNTGITTYKDTKPNHRRITSPPNGTQMGQDQIDKILSVLPMNGNLLVWGLGNDSPFWHNSTDGMVVFLEQNGTPWFTKVTRKYPFLVAYKIQYSTNIGTSFDRYNNHSELWHELDLRLQLPSYVVSTTWDVIIVDAPAGYKPNMPGRYGSIYTSLLLGSKGTHIFVDDYERKVENTMSKQMLGNPVEVTSRPSNTQAHFIVNIETRKQS